MKICTVIPNFNSGGTLLACLDNLVSQEIPEGHEHEIVVVDDGSTDGSADLVSAQFNDSVKLLRLNVNSGRSVARNLGTQQSDADFIFFIDSDCIPESKFHLKALITAIESGHDLVFGGVFARGHGFWDAIQNHGSATRLIEFNKGEKWVFTTSNVCIRTSLFIDVDGFDIRFNRHGFEDRDLFIKALNIGANCTYSPDARVIHCDKISLASVSTKMLAAGRFAASDFSILHPVEYSKMPYSRIDCRHNPSMKLFDLLLWPIVRKIAKANGNWLESSLLPFSIRVKLARIIYGLHFLHGTVISSRESG